MSKPVELLEVLRVTEAEDRIEAQRGALTPMVGRQTEIRRLERLWDDNQGRRRRELC